MPQVVPLLAILLLLGRSTSAAVGEWDGAGSDWSGLTIAAEDTWPPDWSLLHVFEGRVGSGNFTRLRTDHPGKLVLWLESLTGDADLYVSDKTLHPTYDDYELAATSCGRDATVVPASFHRPLGVAIYGHVFYPESEFRLSVLLDVSVTKDHFANDGVWPGDEDDYDYERDDSTRPKTQQRAEGGEHESLIWTIFVGLLKIVFEVLT